MRRVVIDKNVIIAALKSKRGASNLLLSLIGTQKFKPQLSVPLLLEYEAIIKRSFPSMSLETVNALLDYLCTASEHVKINYLWRPQLKDPGDELVLELAVAANAGSVV